MSRALILGFFVGLAATVTAMSPGTNHSLMNASSGPIVLDITSSRDKPITHFRLVPGYSVGFDGTFQHLHVRMSSGKTISLSQLQLTQLHGGTVPAYGAWLVEDSGVRSVSRRDYNLAYRRFHKLWP